MATSIPPVTGTNNIKHAMLVDLTLGATTYYISGAYKPVTYDGNTYTELGSFLGVSEIPEDIRTTNGDIQLSLSGIPSDQDYMGLILSTAIKGGVVKIHRAFFDDNFEFNAFCSHADYFAFAWFSFFVCGHKWSCKKSDDK